VEDSGQELHGSRDGPETRFCLDDKEYFGYIKDGKYLDYLSDYFLLKKDTGVSYS
jgi:hypothetical protein